MEAAREQWAADDEEERQRIDERNSQILAEVHKQSHEKLARQKAIDAAIPGETINHALEKIVDLSPDKLILRWVSYHVRRELWNSFPYRRQCLNFREDFRDGTTYAVLLKKLVPEVANAVYGREKLEEEIDPSVRLDAVLEVASQIEPPATGFV